MLQINVEVTVGVFLGQQVPGQPTVLVSAGPTHCGLTQPGSVTPEGHGSIFTTVTVGQSGPVRVVIVVVITFFVRMGQVGLAAAAVRGSALFSGLVFLTLRGGSGAVLL